MTTQKTLRAGEVSHLCELCDANERGNSKLIGDTWVGSKHLKKEGEEEVIQ